MPLTVPGQNGSLTFSGGSGQQVTVRITGNSVGTVTVKLVRADGVTVMTSTLSSNTSFNLATQTLPAAEIYTISVNPSGSGAGSLNVAVTSP